MLGGGESCGGSPAVTDAARVLRLHLALAAAGVGALAFVVAALISALRFEMPPGAEQHSHWELVRSALSPGSVATLALGSLSIAVGIAALASLRRQWRRSRAFVRGLAVVREHGDVRVIAEDRPMAFCAGLLHPRVHVSTGALAFAMTKKAVTATTSRAHRRVSRQTMAKRLARSTYRGAQAQR
jgi:hypothetical protein